MSNMSYCRFRNTLSDLEDCREHLKDRDLSQEEEDAKTELLFCCMGILEDSGYVAEEE